MSNNILLIRPRNVYSYNNYPPLNLICLGSVLKQQGFNVNIINCALEKDPFKKIQSCLDDVFFVGVSFVTSEVPNAYKIINFIRPLTKAPIVVGGWHTTLFPEQMADCENIDYVVVGEGEEHILAIVDDIKKNKVAPSKIFYKKILDLDSLPLPEYDLDMNIEHFITNDLTDKLAQYVEKPMRWLPYESSRGCPSHCTFCINVVAENTRYRKKSAVKVVNELEHIVKKYNLTHVKILDDNFFVDIQRVRDICRGIIERKLEFTWDAECRCDYFNEKMINDQTLELLKEAGLVQFTLGIESGSEYTLKLMKKEITKSQAVNAVAQCNKYEIIARSSFIIETPGETLDDIKQTITFVRRLRKYPYFTCGVTTFRPYPKCELTEQLLQQGYLKEPTEFSQWVSRDIVDMYTSTEYIRPWQIDGKFSESAAYYLNIESAVRLGNHQIKKSIDKLKNNFFIWLAKIRNLFMFYKFNYDKKLYQKFLKNYYYRRELEEKNKF